MHEVLLEGIKEYTQACMCSWIYMHAYTYVYTTHWNKKKTMPWLWKEESKMQKRAIVPNWLKEYEFLTHVAMRFFTEFQTSRFQYICRGVNEPTRANILIKTNQKDERVWTISFQSIL